MKGNRIRQTVFPILTALIWGTTFVAQSVGAEYVGPFAFNAARGLVAFLFLLGFSALLHFRRKHDIQGEAQTRPHGGRDLLVGGVACGLALTVASNLQQKGLETTTSGKAGFITAMYIVIVPLLGLFLKKKMAKQIWLSVILAVVGLYFLCVQENVHLVAGDFYVLLSAMCFAVHILIVDCFTKKVDGVDLSCVQFLVVFLLSGLGAMTLETLSVEALLPCMGVILYAGVFSSGIAYTLQILAQKDGDPTVVSLLLSLESVFATVAGVLVLHERMSGKEILGCGLLLTAVILAQLPGKTEKKVPQELIQ